jgi:type II restriction enzyme
LAISFVRLATRNISSKARKRSSEIKSLTVPFARCASAWLPATIQTYFFYNLTQRSVRNFFVVPKHFFVREIIQERKPLAMTARRAGWIGCNILLNEIPDSGKIFIVRDGNVQPKKVVLAQWQKTLFLRDESVEARGWLIEVMKCVELIGKVAFDLDDVYAFEGHLKSIYPNNMHVKQKIRQQLQVLRDRGFLDFVSRGHYRLRSQAG